MAHERELLQVEVATPLGLALKTEAASAEAPSVGGEFGVLPGHRPLLAALRAGLLKYHDAAGHAHVAAVGAGFAEAGPTRLLVLTDQFARPEDIDVATTKQEL